MTQAYMMSSSAQRDLYEELPATGTAGPESAAALRRLAAERLAAHRSRRGAAEIGLAAEKESPKISAAAQRVRDAVAARYKQSPSYREFLESQPVAEPTVEVVPKVKAAVAVRETAALPVAAMPVEASWDWVDERAAMAAAASYEGAGSFDGALRVRPFEELPQPTQPPERVRGEEPTETAHVEELEGLEEEIAFRLDPEFVEHLIEPLTIQANIIEFPRQLVAARKARPRLAEGPLRGNDVVVPHEPARKDPTMVPAAAESGQFQMRIFEVEETQHVEAARGLEAAALPEAVVDHVPAVAVAPEWQELVLDSPVKEYVAPKAVVSAAESAEVAAAVPDLPVASFELRLMSAAVDGLCVAMSFVVFVTVAVWMSGQTGAGVLQAHSLPVLGAVAGVALALLTVGYQAVFFTLGAMTPGMSYAGLVFRTLVGAEPERAALQRRVGANVLAMAPLGLGLLWSVFDGQRLGWNDRMSGVFLREY